MVRTAQYSWILAGIVVNTLVISSAVRTDLGQAAYNDAVVPNQYFIEFAHTSDIPTKRSGVTVRGRIQDVLEARNIAFQIDSEYHVEGLLVGAVVTLSATEDLIAIHSISGVMAVWPVLFYEPPEPVTTQSIQEYTATGASTDASYPRVMAGVDKVHAEGNSGSNITIGIIDTGVDYTHSALGGGFGPGFKFIGGYDFAGDARGKTQPVPDDDPLDQCTEHGTHVAGIIGANPGTPHNIVGVAYSASLRAYRIFGCTGGTSETNVVSALVRAYEDGNDVITLSIGRSGYGWSETWASVVASRIAGKGRVVTVAAGNEGEVGAFYSSSPASGLDVVAVASVESAVIPLQSAFVNGAGHSPITYSAYLPWGFEDSLPIYAVLEKQTGDNICELGPEVPDLYEYLVVVRRARNCGNDQIANLVAKGAQAVFLYDDADSVGDETPWNLGLKYAYILKADGEWLVSQFVAGTPLTITFPQTGGDINYPNVNGSLISYFSTYGPTYDLYLKPSLSAPGGEIMSLVPTTLGSYAVFSGTSMATPFVAGGAALLLAARGKEFAQGNNVRNILQTTARKVPSSHAPGSPWQTAAQQGAGIMNIYDAIHSGTMLSEGELLLNDTAHFEDVHTFTVTNIGNEPRSYQLAHVPAGTAMSMKPTSIVHADGRLPLTHAALEVAISPLSFPLPPGQSENITVRFAFPESNEPSAYAIYTGFIEVSSEDVTVHSTYLGLGGALMDRKLIDNTSKLPEGRSQFATELVDAEGNTQTGTVNYTFQGLDRPDVHYSLTYGSRIVNIDLVDPGFELPTQDSLTPRQQSPEHQNKAPMLSFPRPYENDSFASLEIVGSIAELQNVPRNYWYAGSLGAYSSMAHYTPTFANGDRISEGYYRSLVRALKPMGDPSEQKDYDYWLSSAVVGIFPSNGGT